MKVTVCRDLSDRALSYDVEPGKLSDIFTFLELGNAVALVNGKIVEPEAVVTEDDVVFIRQVPKGIVTGLIIAAGVLLVAGAAYAGYEIYKMRRQMEKYKDGLSSFGNSVTNIPYVKGANNVKALDRSIPYIIGKARIAPYVLSEGKSTLYGIYGNMERGIPYIAGYGPLVLRKMYSNGALVHEFTGDTPQEGSFNITSISRGFGYVAQDGLEDINELFPFMKNTYVSIEPGDQLLKKDDPNYTDLIYVLPENTASVEIFFMFNGLIKYTSDGKEKAHTVDIDLYWSKNGGNTWVQFEPTQAARQTVNDGPVTFMRKSQFRMAAELALPYSEVSSLTVPLQVKVVCNSNAYSGAAQEDVFVQTIQSKVYEPTLSAAANNYVFLPVLDETTAKKCCCIGYSGSARNTSEEDAFSNFALILEGVARTWNGAAWSSTKTPTDNPAAWLLEVLTSDIHPHSKLTDAELDLDTFGELYEYCETEDLTVSKVYVDGEPKEKIIQMLCDICFSTLYKNLDGKIAVATDKEKENAIAVINTQNCFSFTNKKDMAAPVDGLRVTFLNEANEYETDAYEVMRPGVTKDANSKIRALTADGITKYEQIVKYAWRLMAIESARPKVTTVEIGNEGVYYTPLSKVLVQHPSLKNGLGSAEIKNVVMSGTDIIGLDLYEPIVYDSTDSNGFGMVIQCVSDTYCTPLAKAYNAGEDGLVYSVAFVTPIDTLASSVVPRSGDILSYGYLDDGEFNTITNEMLITNMAQTERGWRLELVDYNPAIYEYGDIPVYTPHVTTKSPVNYVPAAPPPATLDDVANAIQIVTNNGDTTWIPDTVSVVQAVASQNEIAINWEWSGSGIANTIKRFIVELTKNGGTDWTVIAETNSNTANYAFVRADDGYPESDVFSDWRVRVKAENIYSRTGGYGPDDAGQAVDSSLYIGWTPATPAINTRVSGRGVSVGWSFATKWYGQGDVDLQIAKGYTVDAEGEIELITDTGTLVAYAPATGVDPVLSYENYREGDPDGFLTRAGNAFFIALPLYGQNEDPISSRDTPYYVRVRSVSNQPTTADPSGRETSDWTTWTLVYAHASSAQDVVRAWKLNDLGEKVKIDGALGADQIYVNFLAALSSNLGVITDGALQGNENNMWALSRIYEEDGVTVKYYEGTLRVGDSNQYLRCTPVVSGGVVTSYNLEFKVGSFLVTAVGSVISGEFEVRNPAGTIARLKVDATTGATIVSGGGDISLSAGTGRLLIGDPAAEHIAIDENEIQAKANGTTPATLTLNANGGRVECGEDLKVAGDFSCQNIDCDNLTVKSVRGASQTFIIDNLHATSVAKWYKIGQINTASGSAGGSERGYIDVEVYDGRNIATAASAGTRLIATTRNETFHASHMHYGSYSVTGSRIQFSIRNDGSNNFYLYIYIPAYVNTYLKINANNNGKVTLIEQAPIGTEVYNSSGTGNMNISANASNAANADLLDGQHGSYYAPKVSPAFTGTPTVNGYPVAQYSTSPVTNQTVFPVGSYLMVFTGSLDDSIYRNQDYRIGLADDTYHTFEIEGYGATQFLSGTWRSCGAGGATSAGRYTLFRRVA